MPLTSLLQCVHDAPHDCLTRIELHAGAAEEGDVREAEMLAAAVAERRAHRGESGVACELTVHAGRDHNLVKEMRDAGELHALLRRFARAAEV